MAKGQTNFPASRDTTLQVDRQPGDQAPSTAWDILEDFAYELQSILARDQAPKFNFSNLLLGGDFENWSAGTSSAPDGWTLSGTGATIAREAATKKIGSYSAKPNTDGTNEAVLYRNAYDVYFRGRIVTFGCWLHSGTASRLRLRVDDGTDTTNSSYHTGGGAWEFITVKHSVNAGATKLEAQIRLEAGAAIAVYADGAILVEGPIMPAFAQHPNDEHLKAIDYQSDTPENFDYGLLRMECGHFSITFANESKKYKIITFGTAFSKILSVTCSIEQNWGISAFGAASGVAEVVNSSFQAWGFDIEGTLITGTLYGRWIAIGVK